MIQFGDDEYYESDGYTVTASAGTMCCWLQQVNLTKVTRSWGSAGSFRIRINDSPAGDIRWICGSETVYSNPDITEDEWSFVAIGWDTSQPISNIYVDGGWVEQTSSLGSLPSSNGLFVNADNSSDDVLSAYWAEYRVYNRYLTQAEVETIHYGQGKDAIVDDLYIHHRTRELAPGNNVTSIVEEGTISDQTINITGTLQYGDFYMGARRNV